MFQNHLLKSMCRFWCFWWLWVFRMCNKCIRFWRLSPFFLWFHPQRCGFTTKDLSVYVGSVITMSWVDPLWHHFKPSKLGFGSRLGFCWSLTELQWELDEFVSAFKALNLEMFYSNTSFSQIDSESSPLWKTVPSFWGWFCWAVFFVEWIWLGNTWNILR